MITQTCASTCSRHLASMYLSTQVIRITRTARPAQDCQAYLSIPRQQHDTSKRHQREVQPSDEAFLLCGPLIARCEGKLAELHIASNRSGLRRERRAKLLSPVIIFLIRVFLLHLTWSMVCVLIRPCWPLKYARAIKFGSKIVQSSDLRGKLKAIGVTLLEH